MKYNHWSTCAALLVSLSGSATIICDPKLSPDSEKDPVTKNNLDYENAYKLVEAFLNLEEKPDEKIEYWAKQFILVIKQKDKESIKRLTPFLKDFHRAHKMKNALLLGMAFSTYKDLFNEPELSEYLTKRIQKEGLDNLLEIMNQRLKK